MAQIGETASARRNALAGYFIVAIFMALASIVGGCATPATSVRDTESEWIIENASLMATVSPADGRLSVLDKRCGYLWRQMNEIPVTRALSFRKTVKAPEINGDLGDWPGEATLELNHMMTADAKNVSNNGDCSADATLMWDAENLYLAVNARDDVANPGAAYQDRWWERDSIEFWIEGRQFGISLNETEPQVRDAEGRVKGVRVAVAREAGSYRVEAALPWKSLKAGFRPQPGGGFRFALGINDADAGTGREGQLYFPTTWVHSSPDTFAMAKLAGEDGNIPEHVNTGADAGFRNVRRLPNGGKGIQFETDFNTQGGKTITATLSFSMPDDGADLQIETTLPDLQAEIGSFDFLTPLYLDSRRPVLAVADYCNGHIYPADLDPFPRTWLDGGRLDMPWVGMCDLESGIGYCLIIETSDDAALRCNPRKKMWGGSLVAPQLHWTPSKGRFAYPRSVIYRFYDRGGYVAAAKAYRAYAKEQGLIVPFSEKLKRNPNIARLFGAPDVWGDASLSFAREAKAAGVEKMLIQGRTTPKETAEINALGYITSEYDNYTDILPVEKEDGIDSTHGILPDHAAMMSDGKRITAWLTWDKQTQYMKRCPALWVPAAQKVIPKVLAEYPFLGRFIDVTTAEGIYECYDPNHPLTKGEKRRCGEELLAYVRANGLVTGGEHGIWWCVPHLDYIEGMMSSYQFSWPAGHLLHPKTKDEEFTDPWGGKLPKWSEYEKWGIGHEWRVPLWELVFHDCIVSTWYWGDSNDFLLDAAPEITAKKNAYNILYGTIPMMWADSQGAWKKNRDTFLTSYRNTCKLHEAIAGAEMVSHEFLSEDHALQRTVFSDGTEAIVNFGDSPLYVEFRGRKLLVSPNGFMVEGTKISQSCLVEDGRIVTNIRMEGYSYADDDGEAIELQASGQNTIRMRISDKPAAGFKDGHEDIFPIVHPVSVDLEAITRGWDIATTRLYKLDETGRRIHEAMLHASSVEGKPALTSTGVLLGNYEFICRSETALPNLQESDKSLEMANSATQGEKIRVHADILNNGFADADNVEVALYADSVDPDRRLASAVINVKAQQTTALEFEIDTSRIDGEHAIILAIDHEDRIREICEADNKSSDRITVHPNSDAINKSKWLKITTAEASLQNEAVAAMMDLGNAEPASVRAEFDNKGTITRIPAQYDPLENGGGELCLLIPENAVVGNQARVKILWNDKGDGGILMSQPGNIWHADNKRIDAKTYRLRFENGTPVDLMVWEPDITILPYEAFIGQLVFSSRDTGWTSEPGEVQEFKVLRSGPVRTTIRVKKALQAGVVYEKTYDFYPRRFDLTVSLNKPWPAIYSRAFYKLGGNYEDSGGFKAVVDGKGDAEGVYAMCRNPKWAAVYDDNHAHSLVAISDFAEIAYWDSGAWGGIGLVTDKHENVKMSYGFQPGAPDAKFAEEHWRRIQPGAIKVEWEE
ncbi:MAG TPA: glycoside hydrolase [Candidatus Brocadiia bacterium]|nr:glycoside hydrolase [Candidatus Brocadiia bacterium]